MGGPEVNEPPITRFTDVFEAVFPTFLMMGMTCEQFWEGDPRLVRAYRQADGLRRQRRNQELWLEGIYMGEAIDSTIGNVFRKGEKHAYPSEPLPITEAELEEKRQREQREKMEKIKAAFMVKAMRVNAGMGGNHDERGKTDGTGGAAVP